VCGKRVNGRMLIDGVPLTRHLDPHAHYFVLGGCVRA